MFYQIAKQIVRVALWPFLWIHKSGVENIPACGGVIIAMNHRSNWDVVVSGLACPRPLSFMAKRELFKNPVFGRLIRALNAFPVERGAADIKAIKTALGVLKAGGVLQLFPEGKRVGEGERVAAKTGVAMLAHRGRVPVVPAAIVGHYGIFRHVYVSFGKPILLDSYEGQKLDTDTMHKISDDILEEIKKLEADMKKMLANGSKMR